jgi:hypothetical protein
MSLTVTVTAFQLSTTEDWTTSKFNQGFNPTISVTGNLSALTDFNTISDVSKAFTATDLSLDEITLAARCPRASPPARPTTITCAPWARTS